MATPRAAAGNDENPSTPSAARPESESSAQQEAESRWLETLSEPELDLVISLKELAVTLATGAGHPYLADKFHLRTLRALGIVLLEDFKERLKKTSGNTDMFERLALLSDPEADVPTHGVGSSTHSDQVLRPKENQPMPNVVDKKRKQMEHGSSEESVPSSKKRRMDNIREG